MTNDGGRVVRILLADDHPIVRAGLRTLIDSRPGFHVVGEAADGGEAVRMARETRPDVVLMDLEMPGMGGAAATRAIGQLDPAPHVLILTVYDTDADIMPAIEAGAVGYMVKDAAIDDLIRSISSAARGETVLAPQIAARILRRARTYTHRELTTRELEILRLVADGNSNRDVAAALYITIATVKTHLVHIYDKLGVESRTAAIAAARDRGLIPRT